jgi:hypothetical protein
LAIVEKERMNVRAFGRRVLEFHDVTHLGNADLFDAVRLRRSDLKR